MLELRGKLPPKERQRAGMDAQERCLALEEFASARSVALYSPIRNEVDTSLLLARALADGKRVYYPAVAGEMLEFRRITDQSELICASFGICEPLPDAELSQPEDIDLFLVPGVAFDTEGRRIGYGKGFYDKALHNLEGRGRLIGLCYDFQLIDPIPGAPHDVLMDKVVTDRRVVDPRGYFT